MAWMNGLVRIEDVGRAEGFVYFAEGVLDGGASLSCSPRAAVSMQAEVPADP